MELRQLGKYEIVGKIGQGAMGEVFKAHDPVIGRDVAIKLMSAAVGDNEELRRRFRREAQSAGRLNHPNIVTIYDYGEDQGRIFIAMELLEGRDLKELIGHQRPLRLDEKLDLMQQITEGLAFAHSKDVIHRDLKPANIQLLPSGLVKIMDFGLAKDTASDITGSGMIMGTPHYMSPEQMRGEKATAQSDVFSLGVLFYELLSYRKAFNADSLPAILLQVTQGQPEPLARVAPGVPRAICSVVERALEKDLERRYRNADAMRQALRDALPATPAPSSVTPTSLESTWLMPGAKPSPSTPGTRRRSRTVALVSVAGTAVLLLSSAVVLMALRLSRSAPQGEPATIVTEAPLPPSTAAPAAAPSVEADRPREVDRPVATPAPRRTDRGQVPAQRERRIAGSATPRESPVRPSASPVVTIPSAPPPIASAPIRPSPSSAPVPPPPSAPPEAAAVQDIQRVLSRYESAFEARDVDALKAVHPGLDESSTRRLFSSVNAYDVGLKVERINVSGLVATAECLVTYSPSPKPPGPKSKPLRQLFELTWNGESWRIVRVHTRP